MTAELSACQRRSNSPIRCQLPKRPDREGSSLLSFSSGYHLPTFSRVVLWAIGHPEDPSVTATSGTLAPTTKRSAWCWTSK